MAADLDRCVAVAREVYARDGYPVYLPGGDLRRFLASRDALATWVAIVDGDVAGHVAVHSRSSTAATELATARTQVDAAGLGWVARLLVAPAARRRGVGRALLDVAEADIRARGLLPMLDVVVDTSAIALYRSAGWIDLGAVDFELPDGSRMRERVLRGPGPRDAPR